MRISNVNPESTSVFRQRMLTITNDNELMQYLAFLPRRNSGAIQSIRARQQFDILYTEAKKWVAEFLTEIEETESEVFTKRLKQKLEQEDCHYEFQKQQMLQTAQQRYHRYDPEEVSPANLEQVLFASIPKDRHGNLLPFKLSSPPSFFNFPGRE